MGGRQTPEGIIGDRVRELREARGLSQQALADRMNRLGFTAWTHNTASLTERGRRGISINEFVALAMVLGRKASALLMVGPETDEVAIGDATIAPLRFEEWARGEGAMMLDPDSSEPRMLLLLDPEPAKASGTARANLRKKGSKQ